MSDKMIVSTIAGLRKDPTSAALAIAEEWESLRPATDNDLVIGRTFLIRNKDNVSGHYYRIVRLDYMDHAYVRLIPLFSTGSNSRLQGRLAKKRLTMAYGYLRPWDRPSPRLYRAFSPPASPPSPQEETQEETQAQTVLDLSDTPIPVKDAAETPRMASAEALMTIAGKLDTMNGLIAILIHTMGKAWGVSTGLSIKQEGDPTSSARGRDGLRERE